MKERKSGSSSSNPPRNARACDACRTRKVRCDGAQPCSQCAHFDVPCIVSPSGKRKNPIRGRLVAQVRGETSQFTQWAAQNTATSIGSSNSMSRKTSALPVAERRYPLSFLPGPCNNSNSDHGLEVPDSLFFIRLLPDFERIVFPVNPIITSDELRAAIANMHANTEDAALVWGFAAVTTFLTQTSELILDDGTRKQVDDLVFRCLEAHKRVDLVVGEDGRLIEEAPVTLKRIVTCIFLETSFMAFKRFERSFIFVREAITMIQAFKNRRVLLEGQDLSRFKMIYWEAYIHERFLTIAAGYPSILPPLASGLPELDARIPSYIELGFHRLIQLFKIIDAQFLTCWQELQEDGEIFSDISVDWIESKQAQLDQDAADASEADRELRESGCGALTEFQHADLFVTRLWLRTAVWQLALSKGLLSSTPPEHSHEGLSLQFPVRLASQLRNLVSRLQSVASIDTQGSGIIQKLFEITSTIADVLALPLGFGMPKEEMKAQVEDFVFLLKWLFSFGRIRDQQKAYLREKLRVLHDLYPVVGGEDLL